MKKTIIRFLLFFVSLPWISRLWGLITKMTQPRFLIIKIIQKFQSHHRIDMKDFLCTPDDYQSLSEFFIRPLDPQQRPLVQNDGYFLSPADGMIQAYGYTAVDRVTQIKGVHYLLSD